MTWASVCSTKPSGTSRAMTCVTEGASLSLLHTPSFSWSLKHLLPPLRLPLSQLPLFALPPPPRFLLARHYRISVGVGVSRHAA